MALASPKLLGSLATTGLHFHEEPPLGFLQEFQPCHSVPTISCSSWPPWKPVSYGWPLHYQVHLPAQHKVQPWPFLEGSFYVLTFRKYSQETSPQRCWSLLNRSWFFNIRWPAPIVLAKERFCVSGAVLLSIPASSSAPAACAPHRRFVTQKAR